MEGSEGIGKEAAHEKQMKRSEGESEGKADGEAASLGKGDEIDCEGRCVY